MKDKGAIKSLFLAALIVMMTACSAFGGTYTFEWDANTETVEGYRLYTAADAGGPYMEPVQEVGQVTTLTTVNMSPGNHCFVLTAFLGELESGYSNEVCGIMPISAPNIIRLIVN